MKIDVITLFPEMFGSPFSESIIARAIKNKQLTINYHDMRKWAWNSYGSVDDRPFGGDVGMLIRVDVVDKALKEIKKKDSHIILTSARGKQYTQNEAKRMAKYDHLIIVCGHYEGFDERITSLVDEEISIGNYILTGGEIPAMVIIDSTVRLLSGVLGKDISAVNESHSTEGYIEYPQYTRPQVYRGVGVPEVLLSGDLKKIKEWQSEQSRGGNHNHQ